MSQNVITQDTIDDQPLPEAVSWDTLSDQPTSLADISITDATTLDQAASDAASAAAGLDDLSIQGWAFSGTFSATGQQSASWTSGTLSFKDGTSFSISSGSVSGISTSAPTYVYFSKTASTTVLQTSTTASDAVGQNKVLVAVIQGNSASGKNAVLVAFGGAGNSSYVTGANIAAGTITSSLIAAGTIVASNIAAGTITGNEIASNTITSNKISVSQLSAISADMGSITAGTITGALIRTAASGARVQLNNSTLALEIYDSSRLRATSWQQGLTFYDSSGNYVADIYAGSTGGLLITTVNSGSASRSIHINAGSSGVASLDINTTSYLYANGPGGNIIIAKDIQPAVSTLKLGGSPYSIGQGYFQYLYIDTVGYVTSSGGNYFLPYGMSVSHTATGRYTISGVPFGFGTYAIVITPVASAAKVWSVESIGSSSFVVRIANFSGTLEDNDFTFVLIPQS